MLIDTEALVRHASAVKTQASEVANMLANHRARLAEARQHAAKQYKAHMDMLTADHETFKADIEELWKQIDDAVAKLSGMEPAKLTAEKEPSNGEAQEG